MSTPSKPTVALLLFMSILSIFGCKSKPQTNTTPKLTELDTISFEALTQKAYDYLKSQQDSCNAIYKINQYQNWFYDQHTGELTFSDNGVTKLIVDYEEVGSVSFKSNTWLWAWDNPHLEEKIKSEIGMVRAYGVKRGFNKLTNPKWIADEIDGWEMTSIAAYLMKAKGAYRVPSKDSMLLSYMVFKNIRWPDSVKQK